MKKLLLVIFIVSMLAFLFFLLFAALNLFGYYHVLDGSAGLYRRLHQRALRSFGIGSLCALLGIVCLLVRSKL